MTLSNLDPQTLAKLSGLELKARLIVEGTMSGLHKSPYQGFSVEFAEHREYVPGDDLRYVDWKVYGKSDRFYLKQFEEETNFSCHLLLDCSESMRYRSEGTALSKHEYASCVAASLAYLIVRQQDAAGLVTFDSQIRSQLRASSQPSHLKKLLHEIDTADVTGETSLGAILQSVAERIRSRGLVILISDLFDDPAAIERGLQQLRHRRHDVSVLQVVDPAEQDFPFDEPTKFLGLEGLPDHLTEPRTLRTAYQAEFENSVTQLQSICRRLSIDHSLCRTDTPLDIALATFLRSRRRNHR